MGRNETPCNLQDNQKHKACTIIDAFLSFVVSQVATQPLSPAGAEWTSHYHQPGLNGPAKYYRLVYSSLHRHR
ncbi:hypothetical protein ACJ2NE_001421 [Salmonella enterica subsp. enterica serovar Newport]|nr:hypothetical protein [Salmonella enterica subsp. enterica serovar Newport]EHG2766159.1 hypothetical protein [Salmonella enterica subsp. enterica serovar Newport]EHG9219207.1 hypothetical protein [Salmonella enterica subsp. enterica serovar Newport]EIF8473960.1 hypothetical protein [Salmonella enterica subsp. enterica serovar Newport]EKF5696860.1 hypothetical protein [Salmonella enterica subsp. enterica serovar Newport]